MSAESRWLIYPCVVVSARDGRKMWIVWLLRDPHEFADAIALHSAPDHPLRRFLAERIKPR